MKPSTRTIAHISLILLLMLAGISATPIRSPVPVVLFEGRLLEGIPRRSDYGSWSLPFSMVKRYIDPSIIWDQASQSVIVTTQDKVLRMPADTLTASMNLRPFTLSQPVEIIDGEPYVPLEIIRDLCGLRCEFSDRSNVMTLNRTSGREMHARADVGDRADFVNLTWEYVWERNPTPIIDPIPRGLNVVSPTWFKLKNASGDIEANVDLSYVNWARSRGIRLWPLVSNGFDPELTHQFLSSAANRENFIRQLLGWANAAKLNGINIDFENVFLQDRDLLVQLIRELRPLAQEQGLVISLDVTVKSSSENWSLCYDRKRLAEAADYVVLMAYDQTPPNSPTPGPNAGLLWVEQGIQELLAEVPPEKLILGIPFYTRIWKQPRTGVATSTAASMQEVERFVRQREATVRLDPSTGQKIAECSRNGVVWKVWIEDEETVSARVQLASKYGLAGVASWRRGFETPAAWEAIARTLPPNGPMSAGEGSGSTHTYTRPTPPQ